ncbi:SIR2 family protein [Shewanella sp. BJSY2023SW005]|uniref:SIR2 family protein n=1 Tax=Shewanella sp. BJSY2023SW005 TaxID=3392043 RepID=UPI0039B3696A
MKDYTVLVGNDINNVVKGKSWKDLLKQLTKHLDISVNFLTDKPFPLAYEEICFKAFKEGNHTEKDIKKFVAKHVFDMQSGSLHESIMDLGCEHILTTNYDLCLESVFVNEPNRMENKGYIKENLYSIFRHHIAGDKKVWHIHGSANTYNSITLGYEHYSGYLQNMRNYVVNGTKDSYKKRSFPPLTKSIKNNSVENYSWLDLFLTKNVHIFGLSLDFNETDLWWLLTYREKAKYSKKLPISNTITYYIPSEYVKNSQSKVDMLKSVGVEIVIKEKYSRDKTAWYSEIIRSIDIENA